MKNRRYKPHELMYICKFYEIDGSGLMAAAFDRTTKSIAELVRNLRKNGLYEHYKKLWDQQYEIEARKAE
jgi:hypothetical protein